MADEAAPGEDLQETSLSYAFLYIYELLNQIGVADPMDGYRKLTGSGTRTARWTTAFSHI